MDDVNTFIQQAIAEHTGGNTGGAPAPTTAPDSAPPPAQTEATPGQGINPAPPAAEPFDDNFDYNTLPEGPERDAYRRWHGNYTKKRQQDAERIREIEERSRQYEGLDPDTAAVAREVSQRMANGDILGARALVAQQQQALDMLAQQYGYQTPGYPQSAGYQGNPYEGQQGGYPPQYQEPADPYEARLAAIEMQNRQWQLSQEFQMFQGRLGRNLTLPEQQKMLALKAQAPGLNFDQVYHLTHREQHEKELAAKVQAEIMRRLQAGGVVPPPPAGVPERAPVASAPANDRMSIIEEAVKQAQRGG